MGELAYKTMAGAAPRGLPQVYFCAHPEDKDRFLEQTAAELHGVRNCALWYDTGRPAPDRDWRLELGQMQLFVVTVTARFLHGDCRARQEELPFALQRHIPVLPILREPGLTGAFNALCGDLQALDPGTPDPTGIPYAHKLRRYLETVLIGDDLAAQVRRAFDAYLFLSYRKKDRRAALELMRLIHNDPLCRDVAIWYDEFLTAGRDFKSSIAQAMDQSLAVALVVTPRLNEDKNYVQRVEYPLARQSGKPVLPVEMEHTDRGELDKHFEGLPPCVSGRDEGALSRRLRECLGHAARAPGRDDPRQDDLPRQQGLGHCLKRMADVCLKEGALAEAGACLAEAYSRVGRVERLDGTPGARQELAGICAGLGELRRREGDHASARNWWEQAVGLLQKGLCDETPRLIRARLAWALLDMGEECAALGQMGQAQRCCRRSHALWKELKETDPTVKSCKGMAVACTRMGDLSLEDGDAAQARARYEEAARLLEEVVARAPVAWARGALAEVCDTLGDLCIDEGDVEAGAGWYSKAVAARRPPEP